MKVAVDQILLVATVEDQEAPIQDPQEVEQLELQTQHKDLNITNQVEYKLKVVDTTMQPVHKVELL